MKDYEENFLLAVKMIDDSDNWTYPDRLLLYKAQSRYLQDDISQAMVVAFYNCHREPFKVGVLQGPLAKLVKHRKEYQDMADQLDAIWKAG